MESLTVLGARNEGGTIRDECQNCKDNFFNRSWPSKAEGWVSFYAEVVSFYGKCFYGKFVVKSPRS